MIRPVYFSEGALHLIDQRLLPNQNIVKTFTDYREAVEAIKNMTVRGAPAIGITGAYALVLASMEFENESDYKEKLARAAAEIISARPTAVNLSWAVYRLIEIFSREKLTPVEMTRRLKREADSIRDEDAAMCRAIGKNGAELFDRRVNVLTHCNAGALATAEYGTALGVIRALKESGKLGRVYADETRPLLQGARLTAYELSEDNIDTTLITDNMAAVMMKKGLIDCVVVGADRIAANGDTANKIGTYGVSILAKEHGIPFYIAAPTSTIDIKTPSGDEIEIEERDGEEVRKIGGVQIAPDKVDVVNPAFDVTPAEYINGIITEKGVLEAPYEDSIKELFAD